MRAAKDGDREAGGFAVRARFQAPPYGKRIEHQDAALHLQEALDAYSGRRLPLIPVETCHRFQSKVATDSD